MHKETDNIDTLLRDFDTLSIQHEIEMNVSVEGNLVSIAFNLDHEYKGLLDWNDTHENKIKSIEGQLGYPPQTYYNLIGDGKKNKALLNIEISIYFSNNSLLCIYVPALGTSVEDVLLKRNTQIEFIYTPYLSSKEAIHQHFFSEEELKEFWKPGTHRIKELIDIAHSHYLSIL